MNMIIFFILGILTGIFMAVTTTAFANAKWALKDSIKDVMLEVKCEECKNEIKKVFIR